ncbi:MAG TPA: RnfH family protein [Burkholderiaceae bacterium]|nr:RnfH family protein [Burkholderiaceae bacterium]
MTSRWHGEDDPMKIEVVFSPRAGEVDRTLLDLPEGSSLRRALHASGLLQRHPQLDLERDDLCIGIWGRRQPLETRLRERDRVEVYRPLLVDPKEARRQRLREQRSGAAMSSGNRTR